MSGRFRLHAPAALGVSRQGGSAVLDTRTVRVDPRVPALLARVVLLHEVAHVVGNSYVHRIRFLRTVRRLCREVEGFDPWTAQVMTSR